MDTTPEYEKIRQALSTTGDDLKDAFVQACTLGYENLVKDMLNHPESDNFLAAGLLEACTHGRTDVVKMLSEEDRSSLLTEECFKRAAEHGHVGTLKYLLSVPSTTATPSLHDLLMVALKHHQLEVLRLLSSDIPESEQMQMNSVFSEARRAKDFQAYKALLSNENVTFPVEIPSILYTDAIQTNDPDLVKTMLTRPDTGSYNFNMFLACLWGRAEMVKLIADDPQFSVQITLYKLTEAVDHGHLETVKVLVQNILDTLDERADDFTMDEAVAKAVSKHHYGIIKYFLSLDTKLFSQAEINDKLFKACMNHSVVMTRILLEDPRCDPGTLPDEEAAFVRRVQEATKDFPEDEFNIDILDRMLATVQEEDDKFLYNYGFLVDACALGKLGVIKALAARDAIDKNDEANFGFKLACENGHTDIARFMVENHFTVPEKVLNPKYCQNFFLNVRGMKTFLSVTPSLSESTIQRLLKDLVDLADIELLEMILERSVDYLSAEKLEALLYGLTSSTINYHAYELIRRYAPNFEDPSGYNTMFPTFLNIIYARADRADKIPRDMPIEDVDVTVYQVKKTSKVAAILRDIQIEHLKYHHSITFNEEPCNHATGSAACKEHIENEFWPILVDISPALRLLGPMRTSELEALLTFMMILKQTGWSKEKVYNMANGLSNWDYI